MCHNQPTHIVPICFPLWIIGREDNKQRDHDLPWEVECLLLGMRRSTWLTLGPYVFIKSTFTSQRRELSINDWADAPRGNTHSTPQENTSISPYLHQPPTYIKLSVLYYHKLILVDIFSYYLVIFYDKFTACFWN